MCIYIYITYIDMHVLKKECLKMPHRIMVVLLLLSRSRTGGFTGWTPPGAPHLGSATSKATFDVGGDAGFERDVFLGSS